MSEETNPIAEFAKKYINTTDKHLFLTGKAGTGKTTFLRNIVKNTHKNTVIAAPTGIAAINAGGVTLHSLLQLPFGAFLPDDSPQLGSHIATQINTPKSMMANLQMHNKKREMLRAMELLIIDEVSMLRADLLDAIDTVLRNVRRRRDLPFGGVQMLFIGDLLQLPPVVKDSEREYLNRYYASPYFFDACVMRQSGLVYLELNKIYRQSDPAFISLLNNLRDSRVTPADVDTLNTHYRPGFKPGKDEQYINLTTHNFKADRINTAALEELATKQYEYRATIEGDFLPSSYPVDEVLSLKTGAQVMFIKNDPSGQGAFFNGKIGSVAKLAKDSITVSFSDGTPDVEVEKYAWENKRFKLGTDNTIEEEVVGKFIHYPVKLAWAITIHKSQGLTFERAILDVSGAFAPGQVYVALSRLTGLEGLVLSAPFSALQLAAEEAVVNFVSEKQADTQRAADSLQAAASEYLSSYVAASFDLGSLEWKIRTHALSYDKSESQSAKQKYVGWANELVSLCAETKLVADRFVSQVRKITAQKQADISFLAERIAAAITFFDPVFENYRAGFDQHLGTIAGIKGTKAYQTEIRDLAAAFGMAQQSMHKGKAMVEAYMSESEFTKETVQKLDINTRLKAATPVVTKKLPQEKEDTKLISLQLFIDGHTIDQIAEKRGIKDQTVESHLSWAVIQGMLPVTKLLPQEAVDEILAQSAKIGSDLLSPLKEAFADKYDYRQLRMAMAHKHYLTQRTS